MLVFYHCSSLLSTCHRLHLGQQLPKLTIVHLHAVIEIERDAPVCVVFELVVEGTEFGALLVELGEFLFQAAFLGGGVGSGFLLFELRGVVAVFAEQGGDVFGAHPCECACVVAVQVDEAFKRFVLAGAE